MSSPLLLLGGSNYSQSQYAHLLLLRVPNSDGEKLGSALTLVSPHYYILWNSGLYRDTVSQLHEFFLFLAISLTW